MKHKKLILSIAVMLLLVLIAAGMTIRYPGRMKQMFVQSSLESMESNLNDAAVYTNANIEMNYEEIKLLAGLLDGYLDGTDQYSDAVLKIMEQTRINAGFVNIGIMKNDSENLFAITSTGKKVQMDVWIIDLPYETGVVSAELQTSPFQSAFAGMDAVVYRYAFESSSGMQYMLVAEKTQETLKSILNVEANAKGLTMVVRDNGNVVYSSGTIENEEVASYNLYALLRELGADNEWIGNVADQIENNDKGDFFLTINEEPYYFMFHKIENTDWIGINAYSETAMAGSNLQMVNRETFKLVFLVAALLLIALLLSVFFAYKKVKSEGERKLLETESLFEQMSRHIPMAFAILQEGEARPKFVSNNFNDVIREEHFDFSEEGIYRWVGVEPAKEDLEAFRKTGKLETTISRNELYFSVGVYTIGYMNDQKHYAMVLNDITEDINTRNLLEDSMKKADAASRSKTQFLSKMSHEIRTPLNSVLGFSQLALNSWDTASDEELYDYIGKIQTSGNYLLELVSDILDISRIEEGRMQTSRQPYSLDAMVNEIVDSFQGQIERKHQEFVVDKQYDDVILNMDSYHTKQILNNLISNAYKYTEDGGVIGFEISTKKIEDDKMAVQFIVQDTGIGMSREFQQCIFEPFTQEDRGMMMKKQLRGSGLGMSICKNLVDMQNGIIKVDSELGEGTCFTVQLTYEIADAATVEEAKSAEAVDYSCLKGKKVLVVDDVDMNRLLIEKFLESYGLAYDEAADGQQAVDRFAASAPDEFFGIFMDVNMPVMNGHEATETIRKMDRADAKSIMIAGMTADAFSDDVNKAIMSGMNYHISKPIKIERVLAVLMETYKKGCNENE